MHKDSNQDMAADQLETHESIGIPCGHHELGMEDCQQEHEHQEVVESWQQLLSNGPLDVMLLSQQGAQRCTISTAMRT